MSEFKVYYPKAVLVPKSETSPHFAPEGATYAELEDDGGGAYLVISQLDVHDREHKLRFDFEEFYALVEVVKQLQNT